MINSNNNEKYYISFKNLNNRSIQMAYGNINDIMPSASLIKLFIAGYYLEKLESERSLSIFERDFELMLSESNNESTNKLITALGMDKINEYIIRKGFNSTVLKRKMLDFDSRKNDIDNMTCMLDIERFFELIYFKNLNGNSDERIVEILFKQKINNKIPDFFIGKFSHKTGEIPYDDLNNLLGVEHDVGIFEDEDPYLICLMCNDVSNNEKAIDNIKKIIFKII